MKITIMMMYNSVCYPIQTILVPQTASERDIINAWWDTVDTRKVTDPDILSLPREMGVHCARWQWGFGSGY
jgi:hypothetical protein